MSSHLPNTLEIKADFGARVWFRSAYYPDPSSDQPYLPPCPFGSPVARLLHGCYWLKCRTADGVTPINLVGPNATGRFVACEVAEGESIFVSAHHLAGFVLQPQARGFETRIGQLLEPASWALRRPLPMVFHGPGTVYLYGENLQLMPQGEAAHFERPSHMIAAFDARMPFKVHPGNPGRPDMAMLENIFGAEVYQALPEHRWVVVEQVYRPRFGLGLIHGELLLHLLVLLVVWVISWV